MKVRWQTMPKMTVRIIMKSGIEFTIKCDKFTVTENDSGRLTGYSIQGIVENEPMYLNFKEVAAIVRVLSDGHTEADEEPESDDYIETMVTCPLCNALICVKRMLK